MKIPREVIVNLHKTSIEAGEDIRQQAAIRYYKKRKLSLGKAADLAGLSRFEFIDFLRFNDEPIFNYSDEELDEIEQDALDLEKKII